nr:expressed protein [Hymenolepis microstoma]
MPLAVNDSAVGDAIELPLKKLGLAAGEALSSLIHGAQEEKEDSDIEEFESPDLAEILVKRLSKIKINVAMEFGDSSKPPTEWENTDGRLVDDRSENVLR